MNKIPELNPIEKKLKQILQEIKGAHAGCALYSRGNYGCASVILYRNAG